MHAHVDGRPGVEIFWLPLGAGGRVVRRTGRLYEGIAARRERRAPLDLYHSALAVTADDGRYVVEQAPAWGTKAERGVVATGPVGSRLAGRLALFRYEVRCWRDGIIPDVAEAVDSPQRLADTSTAARRVLDLAPAAPTPVWGRDEHRTGDMWNSNSLVAWLLVRAGLPVEDVRLPVGGRAPGWAAGVAVARGVGLPDRATHA